MTEGDNTPLKRWLASYPRVGEVDYGDRGLLPEETSEQRQARLFKDVLYELSLLIDEFGYEARLLWRGLRGLPRWGRSLAGRAVLTGNGCYEHPLPWKKDQMMAIASSKSTIAVPFTGDFTVEKYYLHPGEGHTWVKDAHYERQRTIREHHVEFIRYLIETNQLRPGTEIARARYASRDYIINGNHTLMAVVRADLPIWITLTTYAVNSIQEIDTLYTTYDRQLPRSARDMLKAYGFAEHAGLSQRQSEVLFGAMRLVLSGFVHAIPRATRDLGYLRDNELMYMAALEWIDEATEFCNDIARVSKRWHHFLLRQSLLAVALVQYRNEPGRAETFWHQVAHENHPEPRHPTRLLAKWCQTESHKERTSAVEFVYMTALAWNAAYHDNPLRSFTIPNTEVPLHLEGTKHTRTKVMRYITEDWKLSDEPVEYDDPKMRKGSHGIA